MVVWTIKLDKEDRECRQKWELSKYMLVREDVTVKLLFDQKPEERGSINDLL